MSFSIAAELLIRLRLMWRLPPIYIAKSRCQDQQSRCKTDHQHAANVRELCLYYIALQVETHRQSCVAKHTTDVLVVLALMSLPSSWAVSWSKQTFTAIPLVSCCYTTTTMQSLVPLSLIKRSATILYRHNVVRAARFWSTRRPLHVVYYASCLVSRQE